ncbi:MAG: PIN domain-containing protein [Thermoplasmatota archaeon]
MKIELVVDANIIISALIGGSSREILFDHRYRFLTTKFTIGEVKKYVPVISNKADTDEKYILETLELIPIEVKKKTYYGQSSDEAYDLIGDIDEKDVEILALAIETDNYLWSEDNDFEEAGYKKLIKTKDFF